MKKFKMFFILFVLLFIYTFLAASIYTNSVCTGLSENVFRLHVLANSNSQEDQNLKYLVRDEILKYINQISRSCKNKEDVIEIVQNNLDNIKNIAQNTVYDAGYSYNVNVEIGNFNFPTKIYGDTRFPPGPYDALRIEIGEAIGENWWCVMFPPLCFIDTSSGIVPDSSKELMQENLSPEEWALISSEDYDTQIKFKVVELLQNISFGGIFM